MQYSSQSSNDQHPSNDKFINISNTKVYLYKYKYFTLAEDDIECDLIIMLLKMILFWILIETKP